MEYKIMNTSGLRPCGQAVLIDPYSVASKGGLIQLPEEVLSKEQMLEQRAIVIAIGPTCWHDEPVPRACVGDHVIVSRYAGYQAQGNDGKQYRFINGRDIFALIEEPDNG